MSLFGAATPAAGGTTAGTTGFSFGASQPSTSTSLFSTPATSSAFSFGAANQQQQTPGGSTLFGGGTASQGIQTPLTFGSGTTAAAQPSNSLFGAQVPVQGQAASLTTTDGRPVTGQTTWEELSDASKQWLLSLEERIMSQRADMTALLGVLSTRPAGPSVTSEAAALRQQVEGARSALEADSRAIQAVTARVRETLQCTEAAIRLAQRVQMWVELRSQRDSGSGAGLPPHVLQELALRHALPSEALPMAVSWFEDLVKQYDAYLHSLEAALRAGHGRRGLGATPAQVAEQVPVLVERIHDMLVRAAARVEAAHEKMDDMRRGFLQRRREFGDERNPFGASEAYQKPRPITHPSEVLSRNTTTPQKAPEQGTPAQAPAPAALGAAGGTGGIGSGLFGSTGTGGGLFGGASTAGAGTSGLSSGGGFSFGGGSGAGTTGGLFGSTNTGTGTGTGTTGGLFGSTNTGTGTGTGTAGGGFSFGAPSGGATGGLFGASTPQTPAGGTSLFAK